MTRIYFVLFVLFWGANCFACSDSHGESAKDKEIAAKICKRYNSIDDIRRISVQETIIYVDLTRDFFDLMRADKLKGTGLVRNWMRHLKELAGMPAVTAWVYVDGQKVIKGQTAFFSGEDEIEFLF